MITCDLVFGNKNEVHLSQILAGFEILRKNKIIKLTVEYNPVYIKDKYVHSATIEVKVDNKYIICYDLADGYHSFHDMESFDVLLNSVDFYFKRSSDKKINRVLHNNEKIVPLGLNYVVSCKGNYFDSFKLKRDTDKNYLIEYFKYLRYVERIKHKLFFSEFENKPIYNKNDYKVLYSVRLYDADTIKLENI